MSGRRTLLAALALAPLLACATKHVTFTGELKYGQSAEDNYQAGVDEAKAEAYPEATKFFEYVKTKYPYSKYAALADLRIADMKFKQQKWAEAADAYASFVKLHPTHPDVDYAAYRAALARYKDAPAEFILFPPPSQKDQTQVIAAIAQLQQFLKDYPDSKYVPDAKKVLAEAEAERADHEWYVADFYYSRQHWAGAAGRLESLVKDHPGSKYEVPALLRLAESYLHLEERTRAQRALQEIVVKHPQDPRRPEAEKLLARIR